MIIKLDNGYFIETDAYSYDLKQVYKDKHGKDVTKTIGYFSSIERALRRYINLNIVSENRELELVHFIEEFESQLNNIILKVEGNKGE